MANGSLFPRTPAERIASLRRVLASELRAREQMQTKHPERHDYWQGRIDEMTAAMIDLKAIEKEVS